MCGYYKPTWEDATKMVGSPPHVRVLLKIRLSAADICGITPACAGTTLKLSLFLAIPIFKTNPFYSLYLTTIIVAHESYILKLI